MGDTVSFVKNEIVDWMYMDAGKMRGNYSAHAILNRRVRRIARRSSAGSVWTIFDLAAEQNPSASRITGGNLCPAPPFFRLAQPARKAIAYRNTCRVF
jgi:hypothetical protein